MTVSPARKPLVKRLFTPPLVVAMCAFFLTVGGPVVEAFAEGPAPYRIVWDDFRDGFTAGGPDDRWSYPPVGAYVPDDADITTSPGGLRVAASGVNARTGAPAFVRTAPQDDRRGVLLDHMKWVVFANHESSAGFPGFDTVPGQVLSCETRLSARTYGTGGHPFGALVHDADEDLRLATVGMNMTDVETGVVFDFMLTNDVLYAFYERLPTESADPGRRAGFSFAIPVAHRSPGDLHDLRMSYDPQDGVARWYADGVEVYRLDKVGERIDRRHLLLDHGGVASPARPRQFLCGMGMYTILDGAAPGGRPGPALVRLNTAESFYFDPAVGEPHPQSFADQEAHEDTRLFGQGASLRMTRYVVSNLPRQ